MGTTAISVPNMDGQGRYTELTEDEQQQAYRNRIKEIEGSQFMFRTELTELEAILAAATSPKDKNDAEREIEVLKSRITYGEVRLKALRGFVKPVETQDESSDAG